jgi:hypothetical protein
MLAGVDLLGKKCKPNPISSTHKRNRVSHPRRDILLLMFSIYARPVMQIQTKNSLCSVEAAQAEIFVN